MTEDNRTSVTRYIVVWGALLALTAATVLVTRFDLGFFKVAVALGIASFKAGLVVFFFMHLADEQRGLQLMVLSALLILAVFIGFTFFDVGVRY